MKILKAIEREGKERIVVEIGEKKFTIEEHFDRLNIHSHYGKISVHPRVANEVDIDCEID